MIEKIMKGMTGWRGSDPTNMLIVPTESVIKVSATLEVTIFVTVCGKLYLGCYNGREKGSLKQVDVGNKLVQDATIYRGQIVFVSDKGSVFSYNINTEALQSIHILEPKKTCSHGKEENGRRVPIQKVSAGLDHILFLSTKGEIWVQGKGPALGLFTNKIENEITNPTRVDFFKGRKVLQAEAGHYFTIALVEALPPMQNGSTSVSESITDLDSYVRVCDMCRKETGDRVLFEDVEESDKCPLGLGVQKDIYFKEFLSPTPSSSGFDGRLSRSSNALEECESSDYILDLDLTSGETSCGETTLNSPCESKISLEMKSMTRPRKHSMDDFEVVERCGDSSNDKSYGGGALTMTRDAAKQFFSRPLSWVTSGSLDADTIGLDSERFSYKYPIDSATEMIRENVASAASLVATSVRTVGDKVGQLSRHFSSTDCVESTGNSISFDGESLNLEMFQNKPIHNISKSESHEWNSLPRHSSGAPHKKTHLRTASVGKMHPKFSKDGIFTIEKNVEQIEKLCKEMIESGDNILNSEVWGWGSSSKGQLGLGDQSHRTTPTNIIALNHSAVGKVVCGSHHTAALTTDGQVFTWGSQPSQSVGSLGGSILCTPSLLHLPEKELAKDVASGDDFLIIVSLSGKVFYVDVQSPEIGGSKIKALNIFDGFTLFHSVMCQSQSIVCTTEELHPKIFLFLKSEKTYLTLLKTTAHSIVHPFILLSNNNNNKSSHANGGSHSIVNNPNVQVKIQQTKLILLKAFVAVTSSIVSNVNGVFENQQNEITGVLPIIHRVEEMKSIYKDYVSALCNAIAISGLKLETKDAEAIVEKSQSRFEPLIPGEKKSNSELFSFLLSLPLSRISEYEQFLLEIKNDSESFYSPFSLEKIKMAHTHWKQLAVAAHNDKVEAELTRSFWSSSSPKLFESLANPTRRLIRDSRNTPINIQNAGRFSSHSFVLLSDVLIHNTYNSFVTYNLSTMWVETLPGGNNSQNAIQIRVPEETLTLICPSPLDKTQWLQSLQDNIKASVQVPGETVYIISRSPPLVRSATYTFLKHQQYKDATYSGQWLCGKMNGEGSLTWPDGKRYIGQFRHNVYQGFGRLDVPSGIGFNIYEGCWKNGKLEGRGVIRYANKDVYVGFLHESLPHGHGELKKGKFSSEAASVYTGEWNAGTKHGYGVLDEIAQGEKYHGMWQNNNRHGPGMVVTMNDVYYEGNFSQNKLSGFGLMILEDGTSYEGELGPGGTCNGKGTLRYPSGDYMEGTFSGSWSEGLKVNGILRKSDAHLRSEENPLPKSFGKLSVPADQKWTSMFRHCEEQLGIFSGNSIPTNKVWSSLASFIEVEKQAVLRSKRSLSPLDGLEKIPEVVNELTLEGLRDIHHYLEKAFTSILHPLGQLMHSFVDAFRATYGGVVAHPRLLQYAVKEIWSSSSRLYNIVRFLFPALPPEGDHLVLESEEKPNEDLVVTSAFVIHPWLLPHLYAPLSPLYVRHHQRQDDEYWQRLLKWNKQSDIALMTFLGVDVKFWLSKGENMVERSQSLASVKDQHFTEAVETLQLLSTSFTPKDKLLLIHKCAMAINQEVISKLGPLYVLSMDDLLPLFLYVVVRSRIQHLGAEIGLIDDLIDPHLQNGELDHVFTTLKACYYHILHETPTPGL